MRTKRLRATNIVPSAQASTINHTAKTLIGLNRAQIEFIRLLRD